MPRIWLIGGTQESVMLAGLLLKANIPCTVTVTTATARSLYPADANLSIQVGRLTAATIDQFLQEQAIVAILDASHPFAVEISQLAIQTAKRCTLPYLRFERPALENQQSESNLQLLAPFPSLPALLDSSILLGARVLLVLGYRSLPLFRPWQEKATLFARILPSVTALTAALESGFSPDRLIALRPPISLELERALWQQWQIAIVVTKASGAAGGEAVKRQVAAELGVRLVVIDRPVLSYPQQTSDLAAAVQFCQNTVRTADRVKE